jgi:hypothetical protein
MHHSQQRFCLLLLSTCPSFAMHATFSASTLFLLLHVAEPRHGPLVGACSRYVVSYSRRELVCGRGMPPCLPVMF